MQFCLDIVRLWQKPESLFIKTPKCSRHLPSFPCSWPFSTCNENTRQECHISPRPGSSANVSSFEKKRFIYNHKPKKEKECCQENNTEHPQGTCIYRNFCASTCNCEWLMTALLWFLTLVICFWVGRWSRPLCFLCLSLFGFYPCRQNEGRLIHTLKGITNVSGGHLPNNISWVCFKQTINTGVSTNVLTARQRTGDKLAQCQS